MIDTELRDDLLDRLRAFPAMLAAQIDGIERVRLTRAGPSGGWGAVEIFCHLRDWDEIYAARIGRIVQEDVPSLPSVDDSLWPVLRDYHRQDPHAVLAKFAERRGALVTQLDALTPAQFMRHGVHFEQGRRSLHWFAGHIAEHDCEHEEQLRKSLG